jgi:hypothetical protein
MARRKRISIKNWPVRKATCHSCPFRLNAETGREQDPQLASEIQTRLLEASQVCHAPREFGNPEYQVCRGARNWQLQIWHRLGVLDEPTDKDWDRKQKALPYF